MSIEAIPNKLRNAGQRSVSVERFESVESVESVERQDIFISLRNGLLIFIAGAG